MVLETYLNYFVFLGENVITRKVCKFIRSFRIDWWWNIYPLHLSKGHLEDLIKEDKNFLNELARNIQRHVKERMELRHVLNIESKHYYFNDLEQRLLKIWTLKQKLLWYHFSIFRLWRIEFSPNLECDSKDRPAKDSRFLKHNSILA